MMIDFYSVQEWVEAGSLLDKSFIITRRRGLFDIDTPVEIIQACCAESANFACEAIVHFVEYRKKELGAASFDIAPLVAPSAFQYKFNEFVFSVALLYNSTDLSIEFSDPLKERRGGWSFEAGAIITLHSKEQNG